MDCCRPRLCENTQELTRRRIVFSIALFPTAATALLIFKLTKSRRIFYAKIERLCFHTAWTRSGHSLVLFDDLVGAGEDQGRDREAEGLGGFEVDDQLEPGRL